MKILKINVFVAVPDTVPDSDLRYVAFRVPIDDNKWEIDALQFATNCAFDSIVKVDIPDPDPDDDEWYELAVQAIERQKV